MFLESSQNEIDRSVLDVEVEYSETVTKIPSVPVSPPLAVTVVLSFDTRKLIYILVLVTVFGLQLQIFF